MNAAQQTTYQPHVNACQADLVRAEPASLRALTCDEQLAGRACGVRLSDALVQAERLDLVLDRDTRLGCDLWDDERLQHGAPALPHLELDAQTAGGVLTPERERFPGFPVGVSVKSCTTRCCGRFLGEFGTFIGLGDEGAEIRVCQTQATGGSAGSCSIFAEFPQRAPMLAHT